MLQTPNDLIVIAQSVLQKALVKFCSSIAFCTAQNQSTIQNKLREKQVEAVTSSTNPCFRLYKLHLQHSIFLTTPHNKLRKQAALHSDNVQAILNLNSKLNKISINKQHRQ
jgi:hypothetical protein